MPQESKHVLSDLRAPRVHWFISALVFTFVCAYGMNIYWKIQSASEHELARRLELTNGKNRLVPDSDSVYVLVKRQFRSRQKPAPEVLLESARNGIKALPVKLESLVPNFEFGFADTPQAGAPRLFWLLKPERLSAENEYWIVYASFFAAKGQQINLKFVQPPAAIDSDSKYSLVMLGTHFGISSPAYPTINSARYLRAGHKLSEDDWCYKSGGFSGFESSVLHLPSPLIGSGEGLKLAQNVICGERLKSSMFCLPNSEDELREFLFARHIDVTESPLNTKDLSVK